MAEPVTDDDDRTLRRSILGCFGCGGLGVLGFGIAVAIIGGLIATSLQGCDFELGDPGPGKDSERLAVTVSPREGLRDRSTVTVTSTAFEERIAVGLAVCLREADTERRGVDACDEVQGARYATDASGRLDATYAVPRVITVGGKAFDCAERPGRCLLVAADASDYDRSGGQPISFRTDLPAPDMAVHTSRPQTDRLPIGMRPASPVGAGTEVQVLASGFQPGEPVLVAWCSDRFTTEGPGVCEPLDGSAAIGAILARDMPSKPLANDTGAVTVSVPIRATIKPVLAPEPGSPDDERTDGRIDCRTSPGRCSIVIAAAADTKRSAVLPYTVAPG